MDSLALLEGLLRIYSPSDHETEAVNYLVAQMRALGFDAFVDEAGNAVGIMGPTQEEAPSAIGHQPSVIVLLGHIDTVPGFIEVRRDAQADRLYGRGAVDAKGPLAAFVSAVAQVGPLPDRKFVVIGAVDEEGDSKGAHYLRDRYCPAQLIIGEPSSWDRVTLGYKGSLWIEFRASRTMAHTASHQESACEAVVNFWNRLSRHAAEYNDSRGAQRVFDRLTLTLREMHSHGDGFTDSAACKIGLRLPPGLSVDELRDRVLSLIVSGDEIEWFPGAVPAHRAEKNTPLVRAFLSAIRAQGGSPGFTVKTGTSDMNAVAPVWNCPTVAYGPGDSSLDHTPEEHVLISEYLKGIEVLIEVLRNPRLVRPRQPSALDQLAAASPPTVARDP